MLTHVKERRFTDRVEAHEDIFVNVNNCLYTVHDISLDGIAFDYDAHSDMHFNASTTLEIFFMSGPILYIENIPFTIVADIPLHDDGNDPTVLRRRACTRFDDLNFRQISSFKHLLADHLVD